MVWDAPGAAMRGRLRAVRVSIRKCFLRIKAIPKRDELRR